jgi:hypothetical protein
MLHPSSGIPILTMSNLAPLLYDRRKTDVEHLQLLAIFHFILAGLAVVGLGFMFLHYVVLHSFLGNPEMWKDQKGGGPPPQEFFAIFKWFYAFFGTLIFASGIANLLSGLFIRRRKNRIFSLIVAGLNCVQFPFGTILGIFTFVVLLRDSVREIYEASPAPAAPLQPMP